jgi:hypothetical protein
MPSANDWATSVAFFPAPRPRPQREHSQDRQRRVAKFRLRERRPRQGRENRIQPKGGPQLLLAGDIYLGLLHHESRPTLLIIGAQGRIRTSVARKERQIYSLLPLTTRPPVHITSAPTGIQIRAGAPSRPSIRSRKPSRPGIAIPAVKERLPNAPARLCNSGALHRARRTDQSCYWIQFSRRAARLVWLAPATPSGALWLRFWSWRRDLNPRPSDYKSDALPAELRQPARFAALAAHLCIIQMPAGTNIEPNTTELRVQAHNRLSLQQLCEDQQF